MIFKTKFMRNTYFALLIFIITFSYKSNETEKPYASLETPVAKKEVKELSIHGDTRIDNYFWMRLSDEQKNTETPDAQT